MKKVLSFVLDLLIITAVAIVIAFTNLLTLAVLVVVLIPVVIYKSKQAKEQGEKKLNLLSVIGKVFLTLIIIAVVFYIKGYFGL